MHRNYGTGKCAHDVRRQEAVEAEEGQTSAWLRIVSIPLAKVPSDTPDIGAENDP